MRPYKVIGVVLALVGLVLFSGCQRGTESRQKTVSIPSRLSCGQDLFIADCIVTSFSENKDVYISNHKYQICPAAMSILMTSTEPQGSFSWLYSKGEFNKYSEKENTNSLVPISKPVAQAIVASILAGAKYIDPSAGQQQAPQRIEGQWYNPIELNDLTLYQNQSGLVDRISLQGENGITYSAKTYNYLWYLSTDKTMPRKIDIFKTDHSGYPKRIMEIKILNYTSPSPAEANP